MKLLITGGAGYIGSHVVKLLVESGHEVVIIDNLSTGSKDAVLGGELIIGDLGNPEFIDSVFSKHSFDAVLHFAASIVVPESVVDPLQYYSNNTRNTLQLLKAMSDYSVKYIVFSSSAAVYGAPDECIIKESAPLQPINPYGWSKLMSEQIIMDYCNASNTKSFILRYFNVAGADVGGRIGQHSTNATHLIKIACQCALGLRDHLNIFGSDYNTKDGTCIRDYIHVEDLSEVHRLALDFLIQGGGSQICNCGYGVGVSVAEVVDIVKTVSGTDFKTSMEPRRIGDPAELVANTDKINKLLSWKPQHADLETIITHAISWEATLMDTNRIHKTVLDN